MKEKTTNRLLQLTFFCNFVVSSLSCYAQNTFGSVHSNYCPTNSVVLNPSSMSNSKTFLDINVVGFGSYTNNNFVFIGDNNFIQVIKGDYPRNVEYDARRRTIKLYNREFVTGPGATWNKGNHGIGIAFNGRSYTGVQNLPYYFGPFIKNGVPHYTPQQNINYDANNIRIASLTFAEIQLSYSNIFLKKGKNMLIGGASIKKFYSIAGGAANIYDLGFNVRDSNVISLFNLNSDAMYTPQAVLNKKGGIGLDLGFTYAKMLTQCGSYSPHTSKNSCRYIPYKYKLGLSIIDIGSVKFNPDIVKFAGYDINSFEWMDYAKTKTNSENSLDLFAAQESDITQGKVKNPNKIKLPTFISAQFDYNLWSSIIYINGTIIQGIPPGKSKFGIRHANSLSISPRFESKLIDFSLPFSLYEYKDPQLGLSLRVGPITIGSDKIVNWLFNNDLYGGDIYFYAKVPIFYHPKCRKSMRDKNRGVPIRLLKTNTNCAY